MSTAKYCEPKSIKKYFDKFLKLVKVPKSEPKSIASKQTVNSIPFDLNSETKDMSHAMKLLISLWSIVFLLFFYLVQTAKKMPKTDTQNPTHAARHRGVNLQDPDAHSTRACCGGN